MALLGSLATGASGVKTQGKSMQVIGNNIANVNTFGFKRNNVAFEDLMGNQYPQGGSAFSPLSIQPLVPKPTPETDSFPMIVKDSFLLPGECGFRH